MDQNAPQDPRLKKELAIAIARERVAETHLAQALGFVRHLAGQVPGSRALAMYARLHHLKEDQHRDLMNGVLAAYGREAGAIAVAGRVDSDLEWTDTATMLDRVLRRLRGRRNFELRRWVERHTGHTERLLLDVHIDNVLRYLEARGPDSDIAVGVYAYMDALSLREGLFEALHILVLDRLYRANRKGPSATAAGRASLRVVGDGG